MNLDKFRNVVNVAVSTNPFYKEWIKDTENVPIIDRTTFLKNNQKILNNYEITSRTSGSTGVPVCISQSEERVAMETRYFKLYQAMLKHKHKDAVILYTGHSNNSKYFDINHSIEEQIDFIEFKRRHGARSIITYPTNSEQICKEYQLRNIDTKSILSFGLIGESIEEYQTQLISKTFQNAKIWSTYSSMEFGLIAVMCPHNSNYFHIFDDKLGVEVLREDGTECEDGEMGRVVITDYYNFQSPLIRYEIGDYATKGKCTCNLKYPSFSSIYGKIRGALLHRNGNRITFTDLSVSIRDIEGIEQYQVIQEDVENFTMKIVCDKNIDKEIETAFQNHFGYLPTLKIENVDKIEKCSNGKYYSSICKV